jgi:hypothetical protein
MKGGGVVGGVQDGHAAHVVGCANPRGVGKGEGRGEGRGHVKRGVTVCVGEWW